MAVVSRSNLQSLRSAIGKKKNANEAKETKDRVRKILTSTYQVIAVVEGASEVNPFAKVRYSEDLPDLFLTRQCRPRLCYLK